MLEKSTKDEVMDKLLKRYFEREDLQKAFPEVKRGHYQQFLNWASNVASKQIVDADYELLAEYKELLIEMKSKSILSWKPLTENEENILESKLVWIFGSPRSGSTWLAIDLLKHPDNMIWNEPYIGIHFNFNRDFLRERKDYIFFQDKMSFWLPALRKFLLACAYAQSRTIRKNLIIKEPNGSECADIILDGLSNSKLIILLRDGRDVVDSLIDAHKPGSWNPDLSSRPLTNKQIRMHEIENHSKAWVGNIRTSLIAFENHPEDLRIKIRYEDLKQNTLLELKKIYQLLGIEMDENSLKSIIEQSDFSKIPKEKKGPGKFYRSATTGAWKDHFNEEEQNLMNTIMGDWLKKLDYEI